MSNIANAAGLVPIPDAYGCLKTKVLDKSASSTEGLWCNSPYLFDNGLALSVGEGTSASLSGSVVCLRNASGKPVAYLAPTDTGEVEVTYDKDQRYRMYMDEDHFAVADGGESFSLTDETATATSTTSLRMLDSSTEHDTDGQMIVTQKIRKQNNAVSAAYTEVECYIDPTLFVQA